MEINRKKGGTLIYMSIFNIGTIKKVRAVFFIEALFFKGDNSQNVKTFKNSPELFRAKFNQN